MAPFAWTCCARVHDRDLQRYWLHDYALLPRNFRAEMIMPVQNKIDRFNQPILRAIVGQRETRLSLSPLLDHHAPLIVDTAAALIGVDNAGLLGATLLDVLACRMRERGEGAQRVVAARRRVPADAGRLGHLRGGAAQVWRQLCAGHPIAGLLGAHAARLAGQHLQQ